VTYPHLPPVGSIAAPPLAWHPSPNYSGRNGTVPSVLFNHVWGGGTLDSVVSWLSEPASQASAHLVYAGRVGPSANQAVQLVAFADKAWTECDLNPRGISIESADQVWNGHDPEGFAQLARMVALILHTHGWPVRWVRGDGLLAGSRGHTRHADAGALGCGHLYCPTADLALYQQFHERVLAESRAGGFRAAYGR
jgi:N-acetyl-anhydromuramyl-L-alanine amidase AmpD